MLIGNQQGKAQKIIKCEDKTIRLFKTETHRDLEQYGQRYKRIAASRYITENSSRHIRTTVLSRDSDATLLMEYFRVTKLRHLDDKTGKRVSVSFYRSSFTLEINKSQPK